MSLAAELFDWAFTPHLVAQMPEARRDGSKLLVVDRVTKTLSHRHFTDPPEFLGSGDVLFRNKAAVLPAPEAAVIAESSLQPSDQCQG